MKLADALGILVAWGPVLFGVGFLAPLIAQTMDAFGVSGPLGFSPLAIGLAIGAGGGLVAKRRGGWV